MKKYNQEKLVKQFLLGSMVAALAAATGCGLSKSPQSAATTTAATTSNAMNSSVPGLGNTVVPTANAITGRIENGLTVNGVAQVSHTTGNFAKSLANIAPNLPDSISPLTTTGLGQIPLLIYSACTDASTSAIAAMFGVNTSQTVAQATPSLIAAGIYMLNQNVGGVASAAPTSTQVQSVFSTLVAADSAAGANTTLTFISVCMAANSYGVGMRGF